MIAARVHTIVPSLPMRRQSSETSGSRRNMLNRRPMERVLTARIRRLALRKEKHTYAGADLDYYQIVSAFVCYQTISLYIRSCTWNKPRCSCNGNRVCAAINDRFHRTTSQLVNHKCEFVVAALLYRKKNVSKKINRNRSAAQHRKERFSGWGICYALIYEPETDMCRRM